MISPLWFRLVLLFSAYFPLFLILLIKYTNFKALFNLFFKWEFNIFDPIQIVSLVTISVFGLSILSCVYIFREIKKTRKRKIGQITVNVKKVQSRDKDVLVYLTAYVLPLVSLNTKTMQDSIIFIILLVLILWLSIRSDLLYINPLIAIIGIRIYDIDTNIGKAILFSKNQHFQVKQGVICFRLEGKKVLIDGTD